MVAPQEHPAVNEVSPLPRTDLLIGGEWRPSSDGVRFVVSDPATAEPIADVASGSVRDGLASIDAAAQAAAAWAQSAPRERGEILRRMFELMMARQEQLAVLMVRESGKSLRDARAEVAYGAEFFRWFSEEAVRNRGYILPSPSGANRILVVHQPVGIAVLVTPWNFPAAAATRKIGAAIAAGCTFVLKPASETPLTALALGELLAEAGLPPGVANVVPSNRSGDVVAAMLRHPGVRKLSFTGSVEIGQRLLGIAAENVLRCSMELGGNAPFIVFADADLDAAVQGAMIAKMRNAGQACTSANRFYVEASAVAEFAERFGAAMAALKVGPGLEPDTDVGPLINEPSREKVLRLIHSATASGARVVTGGSALPRPGFFVQPTVLTDVPADSPVIHEEIFGPVAPIATFTTMEQALALANSTSVGLASYVYTRDLAKALRFAESIQAGMVGINRGLVSDPAAPFGGVKLSGVGREGGHEGLEAFLETKYISASW